MCSEHLVNAIYKEYSLLAIHCGMQKGAVDSGLKIFWFSFFMSMCCEKHKHHSPCMHACILSVRPSLPLPLPLPPHPTTHPPSIHRLSPIIHSFPRHSLSAYGADPSGHKMNPRGPLPASRSAHPDGRGVHINKWLIQSARLQDKDLHMLLKRRGREQSRELGKAQQWRRHMHGGS